MNSSDVMREYRHDIKGKFRNVSLAIDTLADDAFIDSSNNELFHAVHEVLVKMVRTSRKTIRSHLSMELVLYVTSEKVSENLPVLLLDNLSLRYELLPESITYFLQYDEKKDFSFTLGKILALLPVKKIVNKVSLPEVESAIRRISCEFC